MKPILIVLLFFAGTGLSYYHEKNRLDRSIRNEISSEEDGGAEQHSTFTDYNTRFTVHKYKKERKCYLEKLRNGKTEDIDVAKNVLRRRRRTLVLYASIRPLTKLEAWKIAGGNIVGFCEGYSLILLYRNKTSSLNNGVSQDEDDIVKLKSGRIVSTSLLNRNKRLVETPIEFHENFRRIRSRRQAPQFRGRFRGQTQSQYLNIGNDDQKEGKAEAEATQQSSHAVVSGSRGMGQAQSMSMGGTGCEDCPGYPGYHGESALDRFEKISRPEADTYRKPLGPGDTYYTGAGVPGGVAPGDAAKIGKPIGNDGLGKQSYPGGAQTYPGGIYSDGRPGGMYPGTVIPVGGVYPGGTVPGAVVPSDETTYPGVSAPPSATTGTTHPGGVPPGGGTTYPGGVAPSGGTTYPGGVTPGGSTTYPGGITPGGGVTYPGGVFPHGGATYPGGIAPGTGPVYTPGVSPGTVTPEAGVTYPGGAVPTGGVAYPGGVTPGAVAPGSGPTYPGGGTPGRVPSGVVPYPGGGILQIPRGSRVYPGGGASGTGEGATYPGGGLPGVPRGEATYPGGGVSGTAGRMTYPGGGVPGTAGRMTYPGGGVPGTAGRVTYPDSGAPGTAGGRVMYPTGGVAGTPGGRVTYPGGVAPGTPGGTVTYPSATVPGTPGGGVTYPGGTAATTTGVGATFPGGIPAGSGIGTGTTYPPSGAYPGNIVTESKATSGSAVYPGGYIPETSSGVRGITYPVPGSGGQLGVGGVPGTVPYPSGVARGAGTTGTEDRPRGGTITTGITYPGGVTPVQGTTGSGTAYPAENIVQPGIPGTRVYPGTTVPGVGPIKDGATYPAGISPGIAPGAGGQGVITTGTGSSTKTTVSYPGSGPTSGQVIYPGVAVQPGSGHVPGDQQIGTIPGVPATGARSDVIYPGTSGIQYPYPGQLYPGKNGQYPAGTGVVPGQIPGYSGPGQYPAGGVWQGEVSTIPGSGQQYPTSRTGGQGPFGIGQYPSGIGGQPGTGQYPGGIGGQSGPGQYPGGLGGQHGTGQYPGGIGRQPGTGQYPGGIGGQPGTGQYPGGIEGQPGIGQYPGGIGQLGTGAYPGGTAIGTGGEPSEYYRQPSSPVPAQHDGSDSQASSSVKQGESGTEASASAQGKFGQGTAQSQVSGIYTGSGSFSAQAGSSDPNKSAQTEVSGGKEGAISNAQGVGGYGKSQAQVQLDSDSGATSTGAQSSGWNHGTNSQVQASSKGGMADAQANGEGSTSSQAQIGFQPYLKTNEKVENRLKPFHGGGTASAQSGTYRGQSQSQLQGSFQYGITYSGAAQAGSGSGAAASRRPFNFTVSDTELFKPFNPIKPPAISKGETPTSTDVDYSHDQDDVQPGLQTSSSSRKVVITNITKDAAETTEDHKVESNDNNRGRIDDTVYDTNGDYDEYEDEDYDSSMAQSTMNSKTSITQNTDQGNSKDHQSQAIHLNTGNRYNVHVNQKSNAPRVGDVLEPGESLPGYTIPPGFRGRVTSTAGDTTVAQGDGKSQAQTVSLVPTASNTRESKSPISETRSLQTNHDKMMERQRKEKNQNHNANDHGTPTVNTPIKPSYYTVTNSVAGKMDGSRSAPRKYEHRYYTKSSTCGYFTFSCNVVYGSNGRTKICKPKVPTYPDGTPMRC